MKKLTVLLLALAMLCTCFALAACGDDGDTSSATSSSSETSSTASTSSTATSTTSSATSTASSTASSDASTATSSDASSATSSDASSATSSENTAAAPGTFWLTHYDSVGNEGSGAVLTQPYEHGEYWLHIAFKPVDGEDGVYEVVDISDGLASGQATPLAIPEGGFVYAVNTGNNYPALGDDTKPNYNSENVVKMTDIAKTWKKGDKFTFTGIDLENKTEIPTSTPDVEWYDPSYVCTATYTKVG